jgi:hypothetical protein
MCCRLCTAAAEATASGWRQRACAPKGRQRGWRRHSRRAVCRRGELEAHRPGRLRRHHRRRHHRWRHHRWRRHLWGLLRRAALVLLSACADQSMNSCTHLYLSTKRCCIPKNLPSSSGLPGVAPSGMPAMPKISKSMLSRPGLAAGTLQRERCVLATATGEQACTPPAHPRTTPAHPRTGHGRQRARRGALLDDEAVHLVAVHAQAGRAGEALVAVRALEVLGLLVLDERGLVRKLAVAVKAPWLHLLLLFLLAHHCGPGQPVRYLLQGRHCPDKTFSLANSAVALLLQSER